jgi:2-polyprenyl-3-methyl-5-hydroxy-6-metoxy-1,4-benzoquinol methylase
MTSTNQFWNDEAATFDDEPDHGLKDPLVRSAWTGLLKDWLPEPPSSILDVGCGTGALSVVMAGLGHRVTGIDFSGAMIARARAKILQGRVPALAVVPDLRERDDHAGCDDSRSNQL